MRKITEVKVLPAQRLELTFDNGVRGVVDLSGLAGQGVFAIWNDPRFFAKVQVGPMGELTWGDRIDLCPDSLYLKITGQKPEDIFPALRHVPTHA